MKENIVNETVKEKLIVAGITEIELHGISDFSLRRVASSCNVSCAAPYKHFKGKEELISAIFSYINNKWILFSKQIAAIFDGDTRKQLVEISIAYIRFWIANPNFRSIIMMNTNKPGVQQNLEISPYVQHLIHDYCEKNGLKNDVEFRKTYIIRSLIYGAMLMLDSEELGNNEKTINMIRSCIEREFDLD